MITTARALAGVLLVLPLAGCAALGDDDAGVTVAAGFYPLGWVAERVAGEHAEVEVLTQPGAEPHDASLTVSQTAVVSRADVVVVTGGFQPAVDDAVASAADGARVVDTAAPGFRTGNASGVRPDDPHFWHDPSLMADLAEAVARSLAEVDPAHAADYLDRAAALRADLRRLDGEYAETLARCDRNIVVVSHDAFAYLERYGLEFAPVAGLSPDAEPTPADLARLQELIRREDITTVFSERLVSPRVTQTLADDLGVETAVLDPIEGLTDETSDESYLSLMRANLDALATANGCRS